jgi:drug/metabolite transporter (DMT)-like permease
VSGYCTAALAVLIWAAYPVATRAGVTGSFDAQELVTLRFGVGALLFLPYLVLHFRTIRREAWVNGVPLTLFQGIGMGVLVIFGLQFAPANHQAALGPGVNLAWVALLGLLLFGKRPSPRMISGAALCGVGVAILALWSVSGLTISVLAGDVMFLAASALGALYVLHMRNWRVGAIQGAAIVSLYSAVVVVPWYLLFSAESLSRVAPLELAWQILWQGVLIGCVSLIALNHAVSRLGPERSSAMVALVPVLSAVLAFVFLGEVPSSAEMVAFVAISAGVSLGASNTKYLARSATLPLPARQQSVPPAGYPVRDSVP